MGQADILSIGQHMGRAARPGGTFAKVLDMAHAHRRAQREADATVLCGPDCQEARHFARRYTRHVHTLGELWREVERERYLMEFALHNREGGDRPDVPALLARMGANRKHVEELAAAFRGGFESWVPMLAARHWWDNRRASPWLVLLGDARAGKTLAATSCLWRFASSYPWNSLPGGGTRRKPAMFVRVQSLARMAAWDEQQEDLRGCELLVLDDLGAENLRPEAEAAFLELLDVRYGRGALTVITSQLNVADLRARVDRVPGDYQGETRLWRRVRESSLVLEGDLLWRGDVAVPQDEWMRGQR